MNTPKKPTARVLIVEDELAITNVCLRVLSNLGFYVEIAVNGRIGKEMMEREYYDLCLVDIRTPEMNGKELYEWCKKNKPEQIERIIFTTGDVMGEETRIFLEQSNAKFLPKPFTTQELRTAVNEFFKVKV